MTKLARSKKTVHTTRSVNRTKKTTKAIENKVQSFPKIDSVVIILVIALVLVAAYSIINGTATMIQRQSTVVPTLIPTPTLSPEAVYTGTYSAQLRDKNASVSTVTLVLAQDRTVELRQEYLNKKASSIQTGEWAPTVADGQTIEVRLMKKGTVMLDTPMTMTFSQRDGALLLTNQDTKIWALTQYSSINRQSFLGQAGFGKKQSCLTIKK
jgi:hypothetical protein